MKDTISTKTKVEEDTIWLSQAQMTELFGEKPDSISEYIQNILKEDELEEISVTQNFLVTDADGKTHRTKFYNLDVIIALSYRVKSHRGRQFRIWATNLLKEYTIKGFAMDDARLADNRPINKASYINRILRGGGR